VCQADVSSLGDITWKNGNGINLVDQPLLQVGVLFEYSDQQNPVRCPSVQSAGYSCSRVLLTGLPCSALCLRDWQSVVCLQAEELMACVGRCCAARSSVKCLCRTMHAPCSDRTVTVPSPDHLHALTKSGQQPNKDLTRTVPGLFHRTITVLSPCCHWTMHGPCMHHAWTTLSPNHARTEPRPCCDRAMTVTALGPCRKWTMQGPYKGPCWDRSFTVLSPFFHRTVTVP